MKQKYILLFILTLLSFKTFAQVINIPDVNFKNALINTNVADFDGDGFTDGDADTNDDGEIQQSEAEAVLGLLIYNANVSSLEKLDSFSNLRWLNCRFNKLTNLDLSQNVNLLEVNCSDNEIVNLNLSQNSNLRELYCIDNKITSINFPLDSKLITLSCSKNLLTSLDLSQNEFLETFNCNDNQLSNIDVSQNTNLISLYCQNNLLSSVNLKNGNNTVLKNFNASDNPDLLCIQVDNIANANNKSFWRKEVSIYYSTDCSINDILYIPDDNFKVGVLRDADTNNDGEIQLTEAESALEVTVQYSNIRSLEGIEHFINLETLWCFSNDLEALDVSKNTKLKWLWCRESTLKELDVSKNTELERLICHGNDLTKLDVSNNTKLYHLECGSNPIRVLDVSNNLELTYLEAHKMQISSLDVSRNSKLEILKCWNNQIESLDVSNNPALEELKCFDNNLTYLNAKNSNNTILDKFFASNNPDLSCIQVDNVGDAISRGSDWLKDDTGEYSEQCATLGINDLNSKKTISLYPNPVSNKLLISGIQNLEEVVIFSLEGKLIKRITQLMVDFSDLNKGVYFVKVRDQNGIIHTQKILKY